MKIKDLFEAKEKNLLGLTIGGMVKGKLITDKTHLEKWNTDFICVKKQLTSLEGCPQVVSGKFQCDSNKLTSLEHGPQSVSGNFSCYNNQITSLEHSPSSVGGYFYFTMNELTSLKDIHKHVKQIKGIFFAYSNPIKSHVLGLLLIKGCTEVKLDNEGVQKIVNKYLPNDRGHKAVAECQDELIEANLDEYAQL